MSTTLTRIGTGATVTVLSISTGDGVGVRDAELLVDPTKPHFGLAGIGCQTPRRFSLKISGKATCEFNAIVRVSRKKLKFTPGRLLSRTCKIIHPTHLVWTCPSEAETP